MKTQGEVESAICEGISRFELDYMGRGPKDIQTHLIGDILVVRMKGVLTAAERHLVKKVPAETGRDLVKQVRTQLIETARPLIEAMVQEITGVKMLTLHHDISTVTGEVVVLFTLAKSPDFREAKKEIGSRVRQEVGSWKGTGARGLVWAHDTKGTDAGIRARASSCHLP